jgi:hypothetical protein
MPRVSSSFSGPAQREKDSKEKNVDGNRDPRCDADLNVVRLAYPNTSVHAASLSRTREKHAITVWTTESSRASRSGQIQMGTLSCLPKHTILAEFL